MFAGNEISADLQNHEYQEVEVGDSQELLKQVVREKRDDIVLGGDHSVPLSFYTNNEQACSDSVTQLTA